MSVTTTERPRLSHAQQALMAFYWFATNVHWGALLVITLPSQAGIISDNAHKGTTLGTILFAGAFVSMVVAPIAGALSDRWSTRFGRRRPWIVVGTLLNIPGLLGLAYFVQRGGYISVPLYVAAFMWVQFWNNVATAPFSALIPDVVRPDQRGSASGWYGLMTLLGNLVGAATGSIFTSGGVTDLTAIYYFTAGIMLLGMLVTVVTVHEPKVDTSNMSPFVLRKFIVELIEPFKNRDFTWVFLTRLLMEMGAFTVQVFILYYLSDVVKDFHILGLPTPENAEAAVTYFLGALLLGALIASLAAGIISDRLGRKPVVYLASVLMAVVPLVLAFFYAFPLVVGVAVVFGLGYGAYTAVDWALVTDVLPSDSDYAKDMGMWHIALTLPQVIAPFIAGLLRDNLQIVGAANGMPFLGYQVLMFVATIYFVVSAVLVSQIKSVR